MTGAVWRLFRRAGAADGGGGTMNGVVLARPRTAAMAPLTHVHQAPVRRPLPVLAVAASRSETADDAAQRLARLVPILRQRLGLTETIDDAAIHESLTEIVRERDPKKRWRAAFNSTLGLYLVLKGRDINAELNTLLAVVPPTRR